MSTRGVHRALLLAATLIGGTVPPRCVAQEVPAPTLEEQFKNPPTSARPRVWWHWMNGNVTKEGIEKDIAWMKRVGIGGMQNFDINLDTPTIVDRRLAYMTPEWKDAFRFAASEADRQGLELAIASSPGWSETGGPWVQPEDGLKKLVWSETIVAGGKRFSGTLVTPPSVAGPFQNIPKQAGLEDLLTARDATPGPSFYRDVAVVAVPVTGSASMPNAVVTDGVGMHVDAGLLNDEDLTSGVALPSIVSPAKPQLNLDYGKPVTIRSATLFMPGAAIPLVGSLVRADLLSSTDGRDWTPVVSVPVGEVPETVSFAPVTARYFRLDFGPSMPGGDGPPATPGLAMENPFGKVIGGKLTHALTVGDLRLSPEARVDRFEDKAAFALVPDYYALGQPDDALSGIPAASVINLTARMKEDGSLDWTPPAGEWRILRFGYSLLGTTNHPATSEATGLEVDKFDGDAVRRYVESYLDRYRSVTGPSLLGHSGVRALLTDSIEIGAANWTPRMIEQFKRLRGYDPTPWLPALVGFVVETREESDRFLYDYRRTLSDLISSEHYGTLAEVAHRYGLKVYGEALESNRPVIGDDMEMRSHTDVPMAAMWAFDRKAGPDANYVVDIKGAASVAHIYGQNIVAAESMTAVMSPWAFAPADLKRVVDLEFVLGVNRPVIHTSVHAPVDDKVPGLSLGGIGQYFNRNEAWAELAKPWVDYLARNSLLLQQGRNVADVAYFYGEESPLTALYGHKPIADAPTRNAFDFVNAAAVLNELKNDGADVVAPGGARYRLIYLGGSSRRMTLGTLRRLAELAEGGATVVGSRPEGSPSRSDDAKTYAALVSRLWSGAPSTPIGRGQVIAGMDVDGALRQIGVRPDFFFTGGTDGADIPFIHRVLADGDSYMLVNRLDRTEKIEAHFRVTGKAPQIWDAETGAIRAVSYRIVNGETIVPLSLAGEQSVHLVFRKQATSDQVILNEPVRHVIAALDRGWSVAFQQGRGAPASTPLDALSPLDENSDPGVKYFSGIATYASTFDVPKGWKAGTPLELDLGEVREIAEVRINGQLAGAVWHAPYSIEIGAVARPGRNTIEVRVANLWVNRLIGDQQPGATKITWTDHPTYRADAPLRRSGLIGPVRILGQ